MTKKCYKAITIISFLIVINTSILGNERWIPLETKNEKKKPQKKISLDLNMSKNQSINLLLQNASAIKKLLDSSKKEKSTSQKNWYVLEKKL